MKMQKSVTFVKKSFKIDILEIINIVKVRDHCHYTDEHRGAAHAICNLNYSVPKEIPVVFQKGHNYDYHFIIK